MVVELDRLGGTDKSRQRRRLLVGGALGLAGVHARLVNIVLTQGGDLGFRQQRKGASQSLTKDVPERQFVRGYPEWLTRLAARRSWRRAPWTMKGGQQQAQPAS